MQRIVPMIAYEDAAAAIDWLTEAFGFSERREQRYADEDGTVDARRAGAGRRRRDARDPERRVPRPEAPSGDV